MPRRLPCHPALLPLVLLAACAEPDAPTDDDHPSFDHHPLHRLVNSLADPGDGTCDAAECTLREALAGVPANGRITFSLTGTITLAPASGGLAVDRSVLIKGPDEPGIAVDGDGFDASVFTVAADQVVTISRLTITGGARLGGGGGILNRGDLTLANAVVTSNLVDEGSGGGILNDGGILLVKDSRITSNTASEGSGIANTVGSDLRIVNSTIALNVAVDGAGLVNRGQLSLVRSTVSGNRAPAGEGGGIWNAPNGSLLVTNSTISGNVGALGGGIGITGGQVVLQNTTVAENQSNSGGGLYIELGALDLGNTLVASNVLRDPLGRGADLDYVDGALTAAFSIVGTPDGHPLTDGALGNQIGVSAAELNLGPLASNGGPTETHALRGGSIAIDAGRLRRCPELDQRGVDRPIGGSCDVGSYEFSAPLFSFEGFFPPILNPPDINPVVAGAVVQLQFRLKGVQGPKVLAPKSPLSQPIKCASSLPTGPAASTASANGVGLLYDAQTDQYTYPWQTTQQWKGSCRQFVLRLADGTTYRADFDFRP